MTAPEQPTLTLNDGASIPQLGFGVYQVPPDEAQEAAALALAAGYLHIDTAAAYRNEAGVGRAVRKTPGWTYVTTKYFNAGPTHGYDDARAACARSLDRLGLRTIDLYLVHWPVTAGEGYVASWRALTDLRGSDTVRSVGVSNFSSTQLAHAVGETGVVPAVNQVELHPYFQQAELRADHAARGIVTESWGPLGQGAVLEDPVLLEIGRAHGVSAAQVVIRWHLQIGAVVIPKSVTPERIRSNADVLGFELADDELAAIEALDRPDGRIGPDPDTFQFPQDAPGSGY